MNTTNTIEDLMDRYASPLLRYAERIVNNPHTAQDVVQQVFIKYAELNTRKRPRTDATRAWLYRCTHNQAIDIIRSEQRRKKLHEAHVEQQTAHSDKNENRQQQVLENLHLLNDKEQQVLFLRLQEGLSYREIATVTGFKEGHIGYLLHQAVQNLSTHFRKQEAAS